MWSSDVPEVDGYYWMKTTVSNVVNLAYLRNSYDFINVFKALNELNKRGYLDICFNIFGDGDRKDELKDLSKKYFPNTVFWGYLPYVEAIQRLSQSYLALNPVLKASFSSVINKVGDYAASGIPVVNSQNSDEYRQLVDEYKCGLNAKPEDYLDIANKMEVLLRNPNMARAYGTSNRKLFDDMFDRRKTYSKIVEALVK